MKPHSCSWKTVQARQFHTIQPHSWGAFNTGILVFLKTWRAASSIKLRWVDILPLIWSRARLLAVHCISPPTHSFTLWEDSFHSIHPTKRLFPKSLRTTQEIAKSNNLFLSPQPPYRLGLCGHPPLPRTGLLVCPCHCAACVLIYLSQFFSSFHHLIDGGLLASTFFLLVR